MKSCLLTIVLVAIVSSSPVARPNIPKDKRISKHLRPVLERRQTAQFTSGQPIDGKGKGAPLSGRGQDSPSARLEIHTYDPIGGTNVDLDLQNPDNLGQQSTDNGEKNRRNKVSVAQRLIPYLYLQGLL